MYVCDWSNLAAAAAACIYSSLYLLIPSPSSVLPYFFHFSYKASLVTQIVKNMPAVQETWIWALDWEDPLEKGMATHSNIVE